MLSVQQGRKNAVMLQHMVCKGYFILPLWVVEVVATALFLSKRCHPACPWWGTWEWLGPCMALGRGCKCLLLDSPDGAGKQGLGKWLYHLHCLKGRLPECSKVKELEMDVRGVSFASLTLLLCNTVPVHLLHFTPRYSLKLAVTSSWSARALLHTCNEIDH